MLKAAWHWGGDNSVINNHLVEQGCTPFMQALCPRGAPCMVTLSFSLYCRRASFLGTPTDTNE
jgi:hypothetical protein